MDVRISRHPPFLTPRQHVFHLDGDLLRLRSDVIDIADRRNLEPFGDLNVYISQREFYPRFAVDVCADVYSVGDESRAVILEPGWIGDAMTVRRRQVLPGFSVYVELHRDFLSAPGINDVYDYVLLGGWYRFHRRSFRAHSLTV